MQQAFSDLDRSMKENTKNIDSATDSFDTLQKKSDDVSDSLEEVSNKEFPSWALSVMFLGQQMVSVMGGIAQAASSAFNEVQNSVEDNQTGFNRLENQMFDLQYATGRALEPLADALATAVSYLTDFVENNPRLVATMSAFMGIAGLVLSLAGTIGIAAFSLKQFLGLFASSSALTSAWTSVKGVILSIGKGAIPFLTAAFKGFIAFVVANAYVLSAVVAAVLVAWFTNFGQFRDFVKDLFGNVVDFVKDTWGGLKKFFGG